jgi:hypothetical protein
VKRQSVRPRLPKGEAKGEIVPIRFTKAELSNWPEVPRMFFISSESRSQDFSLRKHCRMVAISEAWSCEYTVRAWDCGGY